MSTLQVANRLVTLCNQGNNKQAIEELYSDDIVSVEPFGSPEMPAEQKGIAAVHAKAKWWYDNHTVHSGFTSQPLIAGGLFTVVFKYDITQKASGHRMQMEEIALFTVKDGKIVREQFLDAME